MSDGVNSHDQGPSTAQRVTARTCQNEGDDDGFGNGIAT